MENTELVDELSAKIKNVAAIVIGAGAGLSASAGFAYEGARFNKYFGDFAAKYSFRDMYSGGFYPYKTAEEYWAYWSRYIYINRYMDAPLPVYDNLYNIVKSKDYFVLTTNVDHCFQKAGFVKTRLFYTQGDYGLWQCSAPCHDRTYDNEKIIRQMVEAQGYVIAADGALTLPKDGNIKMTVPKELLPRCPKCGRTMTQNLRADDKFVEDEGWHAAAERYNEFLQKHKDKEVLFLELGVGFNTPGIIKFSFWRMTHEWKNSTYACINYGEAYVPDEIKAKSISINDDIGAVLEKLR
jgi:NAD-dependent SIR2 family protein deacetylase